MITVYLEVVGSEVIYGDINEFPGCISFKAINYEKLTYMLSERNIKISEDIEDDLQNFFEANDLTVEQFEIKHWVSNRSFGEIIDMYISGEIVKPVMQRAFVWDSLKSSRLIESIVMGLPIPPLFLLEVEKNMYEIIDGFQRITTLVNYMEGHPWNFDIKNSDVRQRNSRASKLSSSVIPSIRNLTFEQLDHNTKKILKRSTIPLIEFSQISPHNFEAKYLIFERINTGSEKLNSMQIRKSLAFGKLIETLYLEVDNLSEYNKLYTSYGIKKDINYENYLRTFVMREIYLGKFQPSKYKIKNILTEYCELNKNTVIDSCFKKNFRKAIDIAWDVFNGDSKSIFRRVDVFSYENYSKDEKNKALKGSLNTSILESFLGALITALEEDIPLKSSRDLYDSYLETLYNIGYDSLMGERDNPFTTNTGARASIFSRFEIFSKVVSANDI